MCVRVYHKGKLEVNYTGSAALRWRIGTAVLRCPIHLARAIILNGGTSIPIADHKSQTSDADA